LTNTARYNRILSFKDFKGFKKVDDIKSRYKVGKVLGQGSFG
jgi:serine/threonine protein kinase